MQFWHLEREFVEVLEYQCAHEGLTREQAKRDEQVQHPV